MFNFIGLDFDMWKKKINGYDKNLNNQFLTMFNKNRDKHKILLCSIIYRDKHRID
jgi:hypothetical protein